MSLRDPAAGAAAGAAPAPPPARAHAIQMPTPGPHGPSVILHPEIHAPPRAARATHVYINICICALGF